jgi:hypothetical protein
MMGASFRALSLAPVFELWPLGVARSVGNHETSACDLDRLAAAPA